MVCYFVFSIFYLVLFLLSCFKGPEMICIIEMHLCLDYYMEHLCKFKMLKSL